MNSKWKNIINKIKLNKGGKTIQRFLKFTKEILDFLLLLFKRIWRSIKNILRKIFFPLVLISIGLVALIILFNYFNINDQVEKIEQVQKIIEENTCFVTKCDLEKYINKLETLKRTVFDSNTITFLVSFVLVSLITLLSNTLTISRKYIDEAKETIINANKSIEKTERERNTIFLYSRVLELRVLSINLVNALNINSMSDSVMYLNRKLLITMQNIFSFIKEYDDGICISVTKEGKKDINKILNDIINEFLDHNKKILTNTDNKKRFQKPTNFTITTLKKLQKEILRLKEL